MTGSTAERRRISRLMAGVRRRFCFEPQFLLPINRFRIFHGRPNKDFELQPGMSWMSPCTPTPAPPEQPASFRWPANRQGERRFANVFWLSLSQHFLIVSHQGRKQVADDPPRTGL